MEYPKNGYIAAASYTAIDNELYAVLKRLKLTSSGQTSPLVEKANELIAAGADLNQTGRHRGPLLATVLGPPMTDDKEAVFQMLLECGANPNAPVSGLSTRIEGTCVRFTSMAQVAVWDVIAATIARRLVTLLAEHGADLNGKTRNGFTTLDLAMCRLWEWEERFELQRINSVDAPETCGWSGFLMTAHMPQVLELVETVVALGGRSSLWTYAQVENCRKRMKRVYNECFEARQESLIEKEASDLEAGQSFSFARMDVGEPTPALVLQNRRRVEPK